MKILIKECNYPSGKTRYNVEIYDKFLWWWRLYDTRTYKTLIEAEHSLVHLKSPTVRIVKEIIFDKYK